MNKPSWDDAPEWANWLAQDEDGSWRWYEKQPALSSLGYWSLPQRNYGRYEKAIIHSSSWNTTLEPRP